MDERENRGGGDWESGRERNLRSLSEVEATFPKAIRREGHIFLLLLEIILSILSKTN
jgi:hypothetical protein